MHFLDESRARLVSQDRHHQWPSTRWLKTADIYSLSSGGQVWNQGVRILPASSSVWGLQPSLARGHITPISPPTSHGLLLCLCVYWCHFPACDIVLQLCPMLPLEKLGERYMRSFCVISYNAYIATSNQKYFFKQKNVARGKDKEEESMGPGIRLDAWQRVTLKVASKFHVWMMGDNGTN